MSLNQLVLQATQDWREFFEAQEERRLKFTGWLQRAQATARTTIGVADDYDGFLASFIDPEISGYDNVQLIATGNSTQEIREKTAFDLRQTKIICVGDTGKNLPFIFQSALKEIEEGKDIDSQLSATPYLNQNGPMSYNKTQAWYLEVARKALDSNLGESDGTILVLEHPLRNNYKPNIIDAIPFSGDVADFNRNSVFEKYPPKLQNELPEVYFMVMNGRELEYVLNVPCPK